MSLFKKSQPTNNQPAIAASPAASDHPERFHFLSYYYDKSSRSATFAYQGIDNVIFTEKVRFSPHPEGKTFNIFEDPTLDKLLDQALLLAFILIGTSYYKAHPTPEIQLDVPLDQFQADFFNQVFQEGLSQYAFENGLSRANLAHFAATAGYTAPAPVPYPKAAGILSLQSGGKDSLLTSELLRRYNLVFTTWYVSNTDVNTYPAVLNQVASVDELHIGDRPDVAVREIDLQHLRQTGGLNGHVPVTYILESLAIIQAIINGQSTILTSIGHEGAEPHAYLGDLPVNHQWSKTWPAEQLMAEYLHRYITPDLNLGSPIRGLSELAIAEQFIKFCWVKYGFQFSSCNVANYRQGTDNSQLKWCGDCAKCANAYLLFCPFLPPEQLKLLFNGQDLFAKESLFNTFKGLLGLDGVMKPFECVGSIDELRAAYASKQPGYANLPFAVPPSNFDYRQTYPVQPFIVDLFKQD